MRSSTSMSNQETAVQQVGRTAPRTDVLPKLCGADVELGNFFQESDRPGGTGCEASRALLHDTPGIASPSAYQGRCDCASCRSLGNQQRYDWGQNDAHSYGASDYSYNPQEWGRKYLPCNGGCVYIDLDHLELCLPEVVSAFDHVACWHAMLRIAREALNRANAKLPEGQRIQVLVNNSDGRGNSYGSHTDFLITRRCFSNIFDRKLHYMLFFASYLASSIVLTGAGKVGSENRRPPVDYQISQRADFYETLTGMQTTYNRPIVNSRDESHAADDMARLHVIFFDNTLCHVSSLLKVGVTQIVLAMIEQEYIAPGLILDDPLEALLHWSHDPDLQAKAGLISGAKRRAVELQLALLEKACRFVGTGRAEGLVPRVHEIMALWEDTLLKLKAGDFAALVPRLDWVLKRSILQRAMSQRGLDWGSPEAKHLDHLYSSLDKNEGLYWAYERSGLVQKVVSDGEIERFVHQPPDDTRAWLRAHVLRLAEPGTITRIDWNAVRFKLPNSGARFWPSYTHFTFVMDNPIRSTRQECEPALSETTSLQDILESMACQETDYLGRPLGREEDARAGTTLQLQPVYALPIAEESGEAHGVNASAVKKTPHKHSRGGETHEDSPKTE